ncbi:MAG: hypothetical protein ACOC7S_01160 [Planctomycetota bacterium]
MLTRLILWTTVSDLQCGFKGLRREAAQAFVERSVVDGYGFDAEFVALGRSRGWRVEELPVSWRHRESSKIRLGPDAAAILWNVFRVRWRELLGKY